MLTLPHLGYIKDKDPLFGETIEALMKAINQHGTIVGVDPTGTFPRPTAPTQIQVTSVAGGVDIAIVDANPQRGVLYFVDFDTVAGFTNNPRTVPLNTTRNVYLPIGAQAFFYRAYKQFQGSNPSPYTVFGGSTPQSVMGGAAGTPALGPTQGTGAGSVAGASPQPPVGGGFGPVTKQPPPRNVPGGRFNS